MFDVKQGVDLQKFAGPSWGQLVSTGTRKRGARINFRLTGEAAEGWRDLAETPPGVTETEILPLATCTHAGWTRKVETINTDQ